jgi:hypothetical protein
MKCAKEALVVTLSGMVLSANAGAAVGVAEAAFPYQGIAQRNVFNLKEPPARPAVDPTPEIKPPRITLTLITTIFGDKRAGLKWPAAPIRPGEQPKEESHILSVGQSEAGVEVLEIDEVAGTVKIKNHGQLQTLSFTTDGATLTAATLPLK